MLRYAGRRVIVEGTLRSHPDPRHYWIEDDAYHRVELDDVFMALSAFFDY